MRRGLLLLLAACAAAGCGYSWQSKSNPWAAQGIHKVYVSIMANNSLRAGAEVPFTSAFVKIFSRGNKVRVVSDPKDADVLVEATLDSVSSSISSSTTVPSLTTDKSAQELGDMLIATEYAAKASVTVTFRLRSDGRALLSQSFEKVKIYPGNNRYGLPGTTSALINDSQMQLAMGEIAHTIAGDAYDTMLEFF